MSLLVAGLLILALLKAQLQIRFMDPEGLYGVVLMLALGGLLCLAAWGSSLWRRARWAPLLAIGLFLLVQVLRLDTVQARGYLILLGGWLAMVVTLLLIRRDDRMRRRLFLFLVLMGAAQALLGLSQAAGALPEGLRDQVRGTFETRNTLAAFLNTSLALAFGLLFSAFQRRRRDSVHRSEPLAWGWVALLSSAFMGLAVAVSLSRAGSLTLLGLLVFVGVLLALKRRQTQASLSSGAVWVFLVLVLALTALVGSGALLQRFERAPQELSTRLAVWEGTWQLIQEEFWAGVGPGLFLYRFRPFQSMDTHQRWITHAESDYLQSAAEWGIPAALLFWGVVCGTLLRACRIFLAAERGDRQASALGSAGGLFALSAASLTETAVLLPGLFLILSLLMAVVWSERSPGPGRQRPLPPSSIRIAGVAANLALIGLLLAGSWKVTRLLVAQALPDSEQALQWDPQEPSLHYRTGLRYRDRLDDFDLVRAREHLQEAVRLNPHFWYYHLELARCYEMAGEHDRALQTYSQAVALNPAHADFRWELGNYHLRRGSPSAAAEQFRLALGLAPPGHNFDEQIYQLLRQSQVSYSELLDLWPANRASGARLLKFLLQDGGDTAARLEAARRTWRKLLASEPGPALEEGFPFLNLLLREGRFQEARTVWLELASVNGLQDGDFASGANLIWNGDFSLAATQSPFDWQVVPTPGVSLEPAYETGCKESPCLRLEFQGTANLVSAGLHQEVVLEPDREYVLRAQVRPENITTDQGFFWEISSDQGVSRSSPILGSGPWREESVRFRGPQEVGRVFVGLKRLPSRRIDGSPQGVLWVDNVVIQPVD